MTGQDGRARAGSPRGDRLTGSLPARAKWSWRVVIATLLLTTLAVVVPPTAGAQEGTGGGGSPEPPGTVEDALPMIFVHGGMGSGQQFEAQALRFASNGYPEDLIEMFEYDSLSVASDSDGTMAALWDRLDQRIADAKEQAGADQVYLLAHSLGTAVVQGYLNSDPARAADVAKYVNLDGSPSNPDDPGEPGGSVPDGVSTLAIWGEGAPRELTGATNVTFADQAHTEVVNSAESFAEMYAFLVDAPPTYTEVVRQPADEIEISGRVQLFPANASATGATLNIYAIDGETGFRLDETPEATFEIGEDGSWGPFDADGDTFYEFAITRPDSDSTHHIYLQRFVRSNRWVHLLTSEPGGLADSFWEFSEDNANMVVIRNKEWWGGEGDASDTLEINGESILNGSTSPRSNRTIAIFVHDAGLDGQSSTEEPVSPFGLIPIFLTGVDLHVPAAEPPDGTVTVSAVPRRGADRETFCLPNWSSDLHRSNVQFNSYHTTVNPDGSPAEGHADPSCPPPVDRPPADEPSTPSEPPAPPATPAQPATPVPATPNFTG